MKPVVGRRPVRSSRLQASRPAFVYSWSRASGIKILLEVMVRPRSVGSPDRAHPGTGGSAFRECSVRSVSSVACRSLGAADKERPVIKRGRPGHDSS